MFKRKADDDIINTQMKMIDDDKGQDGDNGTVMM